MKKLLLPLVFAVLAGVASATASTFVNAKKASTLLAAHVADSVEKHVQDSTAAADSLEKEHKKAEAEHAEASLPMTPADSIRAAHDEPTTLSAATKGVPNAADPKHGAPADAHGAAPANAHAPAPANAHAAPPAAAPASAHGSAPAGHDDVSTAKSPNAAAPKGRVISPRAVDSHKPAAPATKSAAPASRAPESVEDALPESKIATLFGKMQPKDAAKILEQMSDSDVRVIMNKMSDKQAAAVLIAFPAARAAAISRGESKLPAPAKTDSSKTPKPAGEHK